MTDDALRFIQVGELVKGISEDTLPADEAFAGTSLTLNAEDGGSTRLSFPAPDRLLLEVVDGPQKGLSGEEECVVTRPRPDVVVVDYVASTLRATSVTIVLDLARSAATTVVGTLPTADGRAQRLRARHRGRRAHTRRRRVHPGRDRPPVRARRAPPHADGRPGREARAVRLQSANPGPC